MNTSKVLDVFQPRIGDLGELVIAGGAVRDELMGKTPKDYDLFCLIQDTWDFEDAKDKLISRLDGFTQLPVSLEWHKSEPYLVANIELEGCVIRILANPASNPEALIDSFDWNVSLFGRTADRLIQKTDIEDIREGKELHLNRVTFPLSTLRRGFRFSERFRMKLLKDDVLNLCSKILDNARAGNDVGPSGNEPDMPALAANMLVD